MSGTLDNRGHKSIAINGMPDHTHIFFGLNPKEGISDLVREIKKQPMPLLTIIVFAKKNSNGKKVSVHFHITNPWFLRFTTT